MRIDRPTCGLKTCRHYSDGNCLNKKEYEKCDYALLKGNLIEYEEIKYANWLLEFDWHGNSGVSCSGCHWCSSKNDLEVMRYKRCPNCGAHMNNVLKG